MAEVFRGKAHGPHGFTRTVVIKRILPRLSASPEFVSMFIDEAKISARLSHPNIVQVFAFAEPEGTPLLVMEHVDGRDLGAIARRLAEVGKTVPPVVVAEIARQCCAALDYAHRLQGPDGQPLNIVHRDVTPSNIMISREGVVKLLDFGIARAARSARQSETAVGTMKGKMGYVAPEQITKGTSDARADLFALGAVMHEALTGRRLFTGGNDLASLMSVLEKPIDPPSRLNNAVSTSLDYIVMRALRRDPRQRFSSAAAFGTALEGYLRKTRTVSAPNGVLRAFMREVEPLFVESPVTGVPPPPPPEHTIALQDSELVPDTVDDTTSLGDANEPRAPARRRRRIFIAAAAAAVVVLAVGIAAHARVGFARFLPAAPVTETILVVLDSTPQGAMVTGEREARPLGETPLLLELPRGRAPRGFWLRKDGYEPVLFKLIPSGSQPAAVKLRRTGEKPVADGDPTE
jgi:serine/threonine protein kinase